MNRSSVVSNRTSSFFIPFYIVILRHYEKRRNLFKRPLRSIAAPHRLFMFSQRHVQPRTRPHLLWKWRCYNEVDGRRGSALLLVHLTESFCIFPPRSSRQRLSPYLRVEFHLALQFFILPSPCRLPFFSYLLWERTIPPVRSSIEQITFRVAPSSRNLSHSRPFLFPFPRPRPSSFGNLEGYRPLLIFTIRRAKSFQVFILQLLNGRS